MSKLESIWGTVDQDRTEYARDVERVECVPSKQNFMQLVVTLHLSCGHTITGTAEGRRQKTPKRKYCSSCWSESMHGKKVASINETK